MASAPTPPRTFFLNEKHELTPTEKPGGGGQAKIGIVDWSSKATSLRDGFARVRKSMQSISDPGTKNRFFLTAAPAQIPRFRQKAGQKETFDERADFRALRSADLTRLGFDLLDVGEDGRALVHAPAARFASLEHTANSLLEEKDRARQRWLALDGLDVPDWTWRVDRDWLPTVTGGPSDCIVELSPVLLRPEAEVVISEILKRHLGGARVAAAGTDYSGRSWWRTTLNRASIEAIARDFLSVQLLHPPYSTQMSSVIGDAVPQADQPKVQPPQNPVESLPVVGLVDFGVSDTHPILAPYRIGRWRSPSAVQPGWEHHAAKVATRIVFGDVSPAQDVVGTCAFFDIATGAKPKPNSFEAQVDDKDILASMTGALGTTTGLRTFVCAFDTVPVQALQPAERLEKLRLVRDLDNFIATNDVVVVVSSGNVPLESVPTKRYPRHYEDPAWRLGPWASAHNTLTCGGYVRSAFESPIAKLPEAPSSFTRMGPGFAGATGVPEAADHAGGELGGAFVVDDLGVWKSSAGTSLSAPLLARHAARAFMSLAEHCPPEARPTSSLVKAFLSLTARPIGMSLPPRFKKLLKKTVGAGQMTSGRLLSPTRDSAIFLWQGVVDGPDDVVRVLLPVPKPWLLQAKLPKLRLALAWNTFVSDAASALWSCRRVGAQVQLSQASTSSLRSKPERLGATYPRSVRTYDLGTPAVKENIGDNGLILCLSYKTEGLAPMLPFVVAGPEQSVAFSAELFDASGETSPFEDVVKLEPTIGVMNRLRAAAIPVRVGILPSG
jgi:hypothetical protein